MTDIRANRQKWIDYLKLETTKKATGHLVSNTDDEARCCLGHACHTLGLYFDPINREYQGERDFAPPRVVDELGLWTDEGASLAAGKLSNGQPSLAAWNDRQDVPATQREIAEYLETVIEGGPDTPFRPL